MLSVLGVASACTAEETAAEPDATQALHTTPPAESASLRFVDTNASIIPLGDGAFALLGRSAGEVSLATYDASGALRWQVSPTALGQGIRPGESVRESGASGGPAGVLVGGTISASIWATKDRPWVMALDAAGTPLRQLGCEDLDPAVCCQSCGAEDGGAEFLPLRDTAAFVAAPRAALQKARAVQRIDAHGAVGSVVTVAFDNAYQYPFVMGSGHGSLLVVDRTDVPGKAFAQDVRVQRVHAVPDAFPEFTTSLTDDSTTETRPIGQTAAEGADGRLAVATLLRAKQSQEQLLRVWLLEADGTVAFSRSLDDQRYLQYPIGLAPTPGDELLLGLSYLSEGQARDVAPGVVVARLRLAEAGVVWRDDSVVAVAGGSTPGAGSPVSLGDGRFAWPYAHAASQTVRESLLDVDPFVGASPAEPTVHASPFLPEAVCPTGAGPQPGVPVRSYCGLGLHVIDLGPADGSEPLGDAWAEATSFGVPSPQEGTVRVGDGAGRALWTASTEAAPEWRLVGTARGQAPLIALAGRDVVAVLDASDPLQPQERACIALPAQANGEVVGVTLSHEFAVLHWREPEGAFSELHVIELGTQETVAVIAAPNEASIVHHGDWLAAWDHDELVLYALSSAGAVETARHTVAGGGSYWGEAAQGFYISGDSGRAWDLSDGLAEWTRLGATAAGS